MKEVARPIEIDHSHGIKSSDQCELWLARVIAQQMA